MLLTVAIIGGILCSGCVAAPPIEAPPPAPTPTPSPSTQELKVHFIDVGQGDSILIDLGATEILIDGGDRSPGIAEYLKGYVDQSIELFVATHPHADHIGGLIAVLAHYNVNTIWLNGDTSTSQTYNDFISAVNAEGTEIQIAKRGDQIELENLLIDVLSPTQPLTGSTNNKSIVILLSYGDIDFLFTGDAEAEAELSMINANLIQDIEILKVGHHGSRTASSKEFIEAAQPKVAIYMAGEGNTYGNTYGHPHEETIAVLHEFAAKIYGTDICGTLIVSTDGKSYSIQTERQYAPHAPPIVLPEEAEFTLSNLSISPSRPEIGETITISFDLINSGARQGTYTAVLKVNGMETATKAITLDAGESRSVSFAVITESSGTYNIEINGLEDTFEVAEQEIKGALDVSASVKFPTLGGGTQTLYATVTLDGQPVQRADVSITVYYKTVTRYFSGPLTGPNGKTQIMWSVGRPRGGYTVRIEVVATYEGQIAKTTTGFYAP